MAGVARAASEPVGRPRLWLFLGFLVVAGVVVSVVWVADGDDDASATTPPTIAVDAGVDTLLDRLVIAAESDGADYERGRFAHWTDEDGDGCNTRCEVLQAERRTDLPGLPDGGWLSSYDGYSTDNPAELEVDHVVALAEAWRSGAAAWTDDRRAAFANDLVEPGALAAVTAAMNQSKSDRDPSEWQPPNRASWCDFAGGWLRTKVRWQLTADAAEAAALGNLLRSCASAPSAPG